MEQARSRSLQNLCFICTLYFEIGCLMYLIFKNNICLSLRLLQAIAMMAAGLIYYFNLSIKRITAINIKLAYPKLICRTRTAHKKECTKSMSQLSRVY